MRIRRSNARANQRFRLLRGLESLECRRLLSASAYLVKDINPLAEGSYPSGITDVNGTAFFFAAEQDLSGARYQALWKSDGTKQGTAKVVDTEYAHGLTNVADELFFFDSRTFDSLTLRKSDGTAEGTIQIAELPGEVDNVNCDRDACRPENEFIGTDTKFFFTYHSQAEFNRELWVSDGSAEGTALLADNLSLGLMATDELLYFTTYDADGVNALWRSDGTQKGTIRVKSMPVESWLDATTLTHVKGTVYFTVNTPERDVELWKTDGSEAGTTRVKDIADNIWWNGGTVMFNADGTLFFTTDNGSELWKSDGSEQGTVKIRDFGPATVIASKWFCGFGCFKWEQGFAELNGSIYFMVRDRDEQALWKSNGSETGTVKVADFGEGSLSEGLLSANGSLFWLTYPGRSQPNEPVLWKSDGTDVGTNVVEVDGTDISNIQVVGDHVFFSAASASLGRELWVLDITRIFGDSTGDGIFNSRDLVQVFQRGEFEDNIDDNSTWEDGDWNGDGDFDTSDLVLAFQTGLYEIQPQAKASDLAAAADWLFSQGERESQQRSNGA